MAQLGGRAKNRIWEKTVFKRRWIKPLFPFKLHFNALATLEVLVGLAGLEQLWGESPGTLLNPTLSDLGDLCALSHPSPSCCYFQTQSSWSASSVAVPGQLYPNFSAGGGGVTGAASGLCPMLSSCLPLEKHILKCWACSPSKNASWRIWSPQQSFLL